MLRLSSLLAVLLAAPHVGWAASVYLNGVNIDGVKNQVFKNATVTLDANGNVFIEAKGYAVGAPGQAVVQPQMAPTPEAPPAVVTQRYWLVTEKAAPGMTQYDIELFINAKFVRKFLDEEEHVVMEITKYLKPGQNKIVFIAKKNLGQARRSASPQHYFRVVIGEGDAGGRNVMINKKHVDYKRTALETKELIEDSFMVTAR